MSKRAAQSIGLQEWASLIADNVPPAVIAERYGIAKSTVYEYLARDDIRAAAEEECAFRQRMARGIRAGILRHTAHLVEQVIDGKVKPTPYQETLIAQVLGWVERDGLGNTPHVLGQQPLLGAGPQPQLNGAIQVFVNQQPGVSAGNGHDPDGVVDVTPRVVVDDDD